MNYTKAEIANALNIIKNICDSNIDCRCCPLRNVYDDEDCAISDVRPDCWELEIPQDEHWKAFR